MNNIRFDDPLVELTIQEARSIAGWVIHSPITSPSMLPRSLQWCNPSKVHQENINNNSSWARLNINKGTEHELAPLIQKLLTFGGAEACVPSIDLDTKLIMEHGQLWLDDGLKIFSGTTSQCHANSATLWDLNKDTLLLATGYALSYDDGLWRQHSWCIKPTPSGGRVIETTLPRVAYFGFVMDEKLAEDFLYNNY